MIAVSNHASLLGGGEYSFIDLLARLKRRWDIQAVLPDHGAMGSRLEEESIKSLVLPLPPIRPWLAFNILRTLLGFISICNKFHPNFLYANGSRAAFYTGIVGRLLGLPIIWHCRITNSDPYLDWLLTRLSDRIIANSHATAKRFGSRLAEKVAVIYNGIDLQWLNEATVSATPFIEPDWKIILMVARISKSKRHNLAIAAFKKVARAVPDTHLICIGEKDSNDLDWWNELQKKSNQSSFPSRVHWIGHVADVRPWYRAAHVLLFPSENEAFGRVLVEAMGSGLPVVANRSGGVPEIVRNDQDGILVPSGSVNEMADAIKRILIDKTLAARLSEAGRLRADTFSIENHVTHMFRVFEETIKSHAG